MVPWHKSILLKHVELQPGLYKPPKDRKVANPTPLGLFAFAYSVFFLGLIQMQVKNIMVPNILVGPALAYGGLVQLLTGMWYAPFSLILLGPLALIPVTDICTREMAIGNTFGATVLSSYGGFWISVAIVFTPGGFEIMPTLEKAGGQGMFYDSFSIYLWVGIIPDQP